MSAKLKLLSALFLCSPVLCLQAFAGQQSIGLTPSNNQIIKLTDTGIVPPVLRMKLADSIVFLLNDSKDSLATIEFNFGKRLMHCAGSTLEAGADGKLRSRRPFAPRDFASTCFHEKGSYSLTAYGLKARPQGLTAEIIVE